jgi:hypothetical protein
MVAYGFGITKNLGDTLEERNPAPVDGFIPLFIGFQPSGWWCRISSIHSMMGCEPNKMVIVYGSLHGFAG